MIELNVRLRFTEPLLGTANNNKDIHEEFIASKAPELARASEEIATLDVPEAIEKTKTVFHRDDQGLLLWDYQIRGFFKETIATLLETGIEKEVKGGLSKWTVKRAVDSLLFPKPRRIYLQNADGEPVRHASSNQRPLRAETMQGPRVALANSEELPAGTQLAFCVHLIESATASKIHVSEALVRAALDYGALKGLGQWRSGGWGRFTWTEAK